VHLGQLTKSDEDTIIRTIGADISSRAILDDPAKIAKKTMSSLRRLSKMPRVRALSRYVLALSRPPEVPNKSQYKEVLGHALAAVDEELAPFGYSFSPDRRSA
jgi:hypothetical protein